MRSVEMKNRCLLYYGNPVGYRTEQGVVADSMFRREELEDWLARKGLAVRWEDGIYDRLSSGGYQKAADNGPALKSCRIWQCQRQSEIVRKRRRNFVVFRRGGVTKIRCFLAQKECSRFAVSGA